MLIPVSLVWIVLVGAVRVLRNAEGLSTTEVLLWVGRPARGGAARRDLLAVPGASDDEDALDELDELEDVDELELEAGRAGAGESCRRPAAGTRSRRWT